MNARPIRNSRVLFLDVDGVLNTFSTKDRTKSGYRGIDSTLARRHWEWVTRNPEVVIVLTSTWRHHEDMHEHLWLWKIDFDYITGPAQKTRGEEIADFIELHGPPARMAILDDRTDMKPYGRYMVVTSEKHGVQAKHYAKIDKLLEIKEEKDERAIQSVIHLRTTAAE